MFDLFALVGAIALIFVVLMLRGVTAMPFARIKASFVPAAPPTGSETLFEEAFAQLAALGFEAPRWVLVSRADGEPATQPLRAALRGPGGGVVWLGPPVAPRNPHRLFVYYSHRLSDGRIAISQPFDCFFASTQTDEMVARTAGELDFAAQWNAHLGWVRSLGGEPRVEDDADVLDVVSGAMERQRQTLIAQGKLRAINDNVAVAKLRFALRVLRDYLRTPKPPLDPRPVPAGRIALLARAQELVRHRAPPRRTQWTLFGVSVAMFMVLGAVFWDAWIALGILLVVMIHELGHFLAMRAFGYRNVHVMALPLVGGVAMGVDANPAAIRQAWMSLMGPLPGIVFGWILLALVWTGQVPESLSGATVGLATLFLLINYLNVLPVPPLDGAHVVQSLLPPRFARVQTAFTGVAAIVGAWFAWHFEFHLLALLALLQLPGLPASWRMFGAERELAADPSFSSLHRNARLLRVLQALERHLGLATNAQQRINFAFSLLTRSETAPMRAPARLATGTVYASLLVVPVAALILFGGMLGSFADSGASQFANYERQRSDLQASAKTLRLDALLAQLSESDAGAGAPAPAGAAEFAAAESRLGRALPDELRALYTVRNGVAALGLREVESIATAESLIDTELAQDADALSIGLGEGEDYAYVEIPFERARRWWHLGGDAEAPLFYLPEPDPSLPGKRVVSYYLESPSAYGSLREWLEESWVSSQQSRAIVEQQALAAAAVRAAWVDTPLETILASYEPPSLMLRWIADMPAWPDGADAATISSAEARLGLQLPPDYAELLRTHDGFPPLQLLGSEALGRWHERREQMPADRLQYLFTASDDLESSSTESGTLLSTLTEDLVSGCVLVAGMETAGEAHDFWPSLVWCPEAMPSTPWVDLQRRRAFPQFRAWLVEQAAPIAAMMKLANEEE